MDYPCYYTYMLETLLDTIYLHLFHWCSKPFQSPSLDPLSLRAPSLAVDNILCTETFGSWLLMRERITLKDVLDTGNHILAVARPGYGHKPPAPHASIKDSRC